MTPSHANKKGVRYRYYVSHALLRNRKDAAGSVARVCAPDIEGLVARAIRGMSSDHTHPSDRDLIQTHVARVTVHTDRLEIRTCDLPSDNDLLAVPFTPKGVRQRGVKHQPGDAGLLDAEARHTCSTPSLGRGTGWINSSRPIEDIAAKENLAERHVRFLLPHAYVSPRIIAATTNGTAPGNLTVSSFARALPHKWSEQERVLDAR